MVDEALQADANGRDPLELVRRAGRLPVPIQDSLKVASRLDVLSRREAPSVDLAVELERSLLGGSIRSTEHGELHFTPAASTVSLPVHMTASVVKSLASLTFYLRHIARRGDFLIIDEPELNLHPDARPAGGDPRRVPCPYEESNEVMRDLPFVRHPPCPGYDMNESSPLRGP